MFVTLAVLKLLKSRLVKPEHPENMLLMSVTLDVLKPLTSICVRLLQLVNIDDMSVTLAVLRLLMPRIETRLLQLKNQHEVQVMLEQLANESWNDTSTIDSC